MARERIVPYARMCVDCYGYFRPNHMTQVRCRDCVPAYDRMKARAHRAVQRAIRSGALPNLKATHVTCADCSGRAVCYDHRDYDRPLDVVAVCHGCNLRRGPSFTNVRVPAFGSHLIH